MNTRESFGAKITEARELKNLSIEEVATKAEIEPNTLIRIEKGKFNAGLDLLIKIADAMCLNIGFNEE